ncbi:MAG TPA: carbon-nitrogen hydrolase family protein [Aeromonadales bacterium]|nr:carbon-nitrogen hydrolase family protein [Aeromonadales bacterium]
MSKFSIAGLQLPLDNQNNLAILCKEIDTAISRFPWIDMIVLGELSAYGTSHEFAQPKNTEMESSFCELAVKHNIWIIPGSYFEKKEGRLFNTSPVINPQGQVIDRYRKLFPFFPYEKGVCSGESFVVFEVPDVGKIGLMICYDQWFPEVSRTLAWMGAEAIICPTLTNTIDRPVELILAQANAAVNQSYFININSTGNIGYGKSIIVGPEGETIYQASVGREVIPVQIDFDRVRDVRERGFHGLGQTLKSFRDHPINFPVYRDRNDSGALADLGALQVPQKTNGKAV